MAKALIALIDGLLWLRKRTVKQLPKPVIIKTQQRELHGQIYVFGKPQLYERACRSVWMRGKSLTPLIKKG